MTESERIIKVMATADDEKVVMVLVLEPADDTLGAKEIARRLVDVSSE